jgi:hypothetical protein
MSWSKTKTKWLIRLLVSILLLGPVSVAWAASPGKESLADPRRPVVLRGEVVTIDGTTLTIENPWCEVMVQTDENTRFLVPGLTDATIDDLNLGDTVAVRSPRPQEGQTPYGAAVAVLRGSDGEPAGVVGRLSDIAGAALTVELRSGDEVQLLTDENTQFFVPGVKAANVDDLEAGVIIAAQVVEREDGSLYTSAVKAGRTQPQPRWGALLGRISGIQEDTIILNTRRGKVTVHTGEQTRFWLPGVDESGIDDLAIGRIIGVVGRWNQDASLQAWAVAARGVRQILPSDQPLSP